MATAEDYELTKTIWYMLVGSWVDDPKKLPVKNRIDLLTEKEMGVFSYLRKHQNSTLYAIEQEFGFLPNSVVNTLVMYELVKENRLGNVMGYTTYDFIPAEEKPNPL